MQTPAALVITLLFYVLLTASCLGWGQMLARLLGIRANGRGIGFAEVWLGWCGVLFLLQFCHYFVPLNAYPSASIYGLGLFLFVWSYLTGKAGTPWEEYREIGKVAGWGFFILTLWVALQAMKSPADYDSGLYHFNSIRWINEYAIVPGLGNLHDRLAFNYAYFPFVASLNFYPWFNHGHNVATGWLLLLLSAECLFYFSQIWQALRNKQAPLIEDLLPALLFPYLLFVSSKMGLSAPQPDSASLLIRLMIFIYLWRNLTTKNKADVFMSAKILLVLGVTAMTLKLSSLLFAGTACLISIWRCYHEETRGLWELSKDLGRTMLLSFVILLTWLGRSIIMSGYPLYPSTFLGLHTDWTVAPDAAKQTANWVYSWARLPGRNYALVLKDWSWLPPWSGRIWKLEKIEVVIPVAIFLVAALTGASSVVKSICNHKPVSRLYLGVVPALAGLTYWFYVAPDPRFAYGLFWLLPLSVLCPYVMSQPSMELKRKGVIALMMMMCLPLVFGTRQMLKQDFRFSNSGWKPIKTMGLGEKTTAQGLKIHVPIDTDQCWNSLLPSTPYFDPALQLRGTGLQSGFKTLERTKP